MWAMPEMLDWFDCKLVQEYYVINAKWSYMNINWENKNIHEFKEIHFLLKTKGPLKRS